MFSQCGCLFVGVAFTQERPWCWSRAAVSQPETADQTQEDASADHTVKQQDASKHMQVSINVEFINIHGHDNNPDDTHLDMT